MSAADLPIDLRGRIALVTGGTGGMGRVITTELARAGAHVVTTSRDHERGDALRQLCAATTRRPGGDRVPSESCQLYLTRGTAPYGKRST